MDAVFHAWIYQQYKAMFGSVLRLFTFFLICSTSEDLKQIQAKPGDDVVLQCKGTGHATIELLEWSRPDLKSGYVFYYRDDIIQDDFQDESYHGRVELKDPQMRDGEASVVLRNVYSNDTGTYKCHIKMGTTRTLRSNSLEVTSSIVLKVNSPGEGGGKAGLILGLTVTALVVVAGIMFYYRKEICKK